MLLERRDYRIHRARADAAQRAGHTNQVDRAVPTRAVCDRHAVGIRVADLQEVTAHGQTRVQRTAARYAPNSALAEARLVPETRVQDAATTNHRTPASETTLLSARCLRATTQSEHA